MGTGEGEEEQKKEKQQKEEEEGPAGVSLHLTAANSRLSTGQAETSSRATAHSLLLHLTLPYCPPTTFIPLPYKAVYQLHIGNCCTVHSGAQSLPSITHIALLPTAHRRPAAECEQLASSDQKNLSRMKRIWSCWSKG